MKAARACTAKIWLLEIWATAEKINIISIQKARNMNFWENTLNISLVYTNIYLYIENYIQYILNQ